MSGRCASCHASHIDMLQEQHDDLAGDPPHDDEDIALLEAYRAAIELMERAPLMEAAVCTTLRLALIPLTGAARFLRRPELALLDPPTIDNSIAVLRTMLEDLEAAQDVEPST
jgi:hypothetical protein